MTRGLLVAMLAAMLASGCGGSSPTSASPTVAQAAGTWDIFMVLAAVTGGECVGTLAQAGIGLVQNGTLAITQNGETLSATMTTDVACTYTGTASQQSITLNGNSCDNGTAVQLTCLNGQVREMRFGGDTLTLSISGRTGSGTGSERWNVFSLSGESFGQMSLNANVTLTKR